MNLPRRPILIRALAFLGLAGVLLALGGWQDAPPPVQPGEGAPPAGLAPVAASAAMEFTHYDVFLDSGAAALGAYQVEITFAEGVSLVGIEGGEHAAFAEPPYYDPAALHRAARSRVILGAFNTGAELPSGRTRVARLHVQVSGAAPGYESKVVVTANREGNPIDTELTLVPGVNK